MDGKDGVAAVGLRYESISDMPEGMRELAGKAIAKQFQKRGEKSVGNADKPVAKSKYGNQKAERESLRFDSRKEARRFDELLAMQKAGEIWDLHLQEEFVLKPTYLLPDGTRSRAIKYRADFTYWRCCPGGGAEKVVEDVKSRATMTPVYNMKKKLMQQVHGLEIREV